MNINNIKISNYYKLTDTTLYDAVFEYLQPVNQFKGSYCDFDSLTFDQVSVFKKLIENPTLDNLRFLYAELYKEWFDSGNVIEFMQSYKWMIKKLTEVIERERKLLFSIPDPKLIQAGVNKLNKFGTLNTKINLAQQFHVEPREVGRWKYIDVLHIQAHNMITKEIQTNLSKIK